MKDKICIFAGTTEGRLLAAMLKDAADVTACVATEYGEVLLDEIEGISVHTGRMDEAEMARFFAAQRFVRVIDATHPYAAEATKNIAAAAKTAGVPVLRILREGDRAVPDAVYVETAEAARDYLQGKTGQILLTTGAKELSAFAGLDRSCVWARVLPLASSLEACEKAGIPASHIIAAQGPFSYEMNLAQLNAVGASYLVTKDSGKNGGFWEKIEAAKAAGVVPVIIGLPQQTEGLTFDEAAAQLEKEYPLQNRKITIVGIGPGSADDLTAEAKRALDACDAVLGAKPVLDTLSLSKPTCAVYQPEKVRAFLESHASVRRAAIVMRGDPGFFSGAKKLLQELRDEDVTVLPGIASPVLLAARLGVSWEDAAFLSLHGRQANLVRTVARSAKVFVLSDGERTPAYILQTLCAYGLGGCRCAVGERLSYPKERIVKGTADSLKDGQYDALSVVYIENDCPEKGVQAGLPDAAFIRGSVPMTKAEVRAVSMSKFGLQSDSVVWDIGAGTGSVSVECALAAFDGSVYAVEKNPEGVGLIRQNAIRFKADNLHIIEGSAPEAMRDLPTPTHVFVGGSGGALKEILTLAFEKNPAAVVVIHAVTLETQAEVLACAKTFASAAFEAVSVSVARAQQMGRYHLSAAQNPVWIYTLRGGTADG